MNLGYKEIIPTSQSCTFISSSFGSLTLGFLRRGGGRKRIGSDWVLTYKEKEV